MSEKLCELKKKGEGTGGGVDFNDYLTIYGYIISALVYYGTLEEYLKSSPKSGVDMANSKTLKTSEQDINEFISAKISSTNPFSSGGTVTIKFKKRCKVIGVYASPQTSGTPYPYEKHQIDSIFNANDTLSIECYKTSASTTNYTLSYQFTCISV